MAGSSETKLTPMMQRYMEVKRETPGSILLFRMGDFYELFHEDAETAAKVLGLTLTSRDKGSTNPVPMAGFPYHALDGYLRKLIAAGYKAAICDQVEDPKTAKGMVRREVTRIVTPGTLTEESLLDPRESNYLAAVCPTKTGVGLAWLELSTGRFQCYDIEVPVPSPNAQTAVSRVPGRSMLLDELARLRPAECLLSEDTLNHPLLADLIDTAPPAGAEDSGEGTESVAKPSRRPRTPLSVIPEMILTERPAWDFTTSQALQTLLKHFQTQSLEGFDINDDGTPAVVAAGALLNYVQETQRSALGHITRLEPYRRGSTMLIDETTRRSLELMRTQRDGKREGSLLSVLDRTATPMGARLLADWLSAPLTDIAAINRRLDAVEELTRNTPLCRDIEDQLTQAYDLSRLASRVATLRASPRDLVALARTLALLPKLKAKLAARTSDLLATLEQRLELCPEVRQEIETAVVDEPPLAVTDGGIFREGYNSRLDELRDLARGGKKWIAEYQARESERTGITSLKVGFNKVFGYYLEVTAANQSKVPSDYIRKQTLKNLERYVTPELKEYEDKVLRAEEQATALEQELYTALRDRVSQETTRLQQTAEVLAEIDVLTSLATTAVRRRYCRPTLTSDPVLDIKAGRHPVLEELQPSGQFVPNDIALGGGRETRDERREEEAGVGRELSDESREKDDDSAALLSHLSSLLSQPLIALITGPNMAGKSTYIRQAALITVMGQIGSFVPASSAVIGIADRVFARVGASDELGKGQSTFMVEMTETARILNAATKSSLVILDEIGRGTSTYDGISLAWAITEFLHDDVGCRTLFATHYHELTELPKTLPRCGNWNVAVHEQDGDVIFLHSIVPGAADRSYGIHVARLAGVPSDVILRADVILRQLEEDHHDEEGKPKIPARPKREPGIRQRSLFGPEHHPLVDELKGLDLDHLTPLQAMQELARLKERFKG